MSEHVSALATSTSSRADERAQTAAECEVLAAEARKYDKAIATLIGRLADAVRRGDRDEIRGYAGAIDPQAVSELLVGRRSWIWGVFEVLRNVLVFAPIAVTGYGLSTAAPAYATLLTAHPAMASRPFLLLWETGFNGAPGVPTFGTVAATDATLI